MSDLNFYLRDKIPLSLTKIINGVIQTGLTVSVVVKDVITGSILLSTTNVPETIAGNGIYTYLWTHGLSSETDCVALFTVAGSPAYAYVNYFTIGDNDLSVSRAI